MTQNRSSAVMAQRKEPSDSLDFFPTPLWATRALVEHVIGDRWGRATAWDPACGQGHMARPLREYFGKVHASDVHPYGYGEVHDFLMPFLPPKIDQDGVDWIITNPPFRLGTQFIERAFAIGSRGAAMLVRLQFLESVGRYDALFRDRPPQIVAQFTERVPMFKGRLSRTSATATAYAWLVWQIVGNMGTRFLWIPPCRSRLERPGDWVEGLT
jgi:hypothetical protein